jgi:uncharacterized protein
MMENRMQKMNTYALIKEFLAQEKIAMVGVSRDPQHFSRRLFRELSQRGYGMLPVNPGAAEIEGIHCYPSVAAIPIPVKSALLMTTRKVTDHVVKECASAGIDLVWVYGTSGPKQVSTHTLRICEQHGLGVIPGYCPYMFLGNAAFYHRLHGFICKVTGQYPKLGTQLNT